MAKKEFPDIDGIVLSMAVGMDYNTRVEFGKHLNELANDILIVPADDTEQKIRDFMSSLNQEGNSNDNQY